MTDLEALVVAAYVFADEYPVPARGGRPPLVSDAELVALAVAQAAIGISSDRQFLGLIGRVLPGWFPHLPDQSQYNRRLRGLVELISIVQQRLARWLDTGGVRLADGTQLAVADYPGCQQQSDFAGFARYGYRPLPAPLHLGRPARPADRRARAAARLHDRAREREGVRAARRPADRHAGRGRDRRQGLLGPRLPRTTRRRRHQLLTPDKTRTAANLGRERALASTRLVIESVFSNLKGQMRLEQHLAKTPAGLAVRIAQRILALTLGILLNTLNGRPARALAAYDGR